MSAIGLTGDIEHPFTVEPSSAEVTVTPGGGAVRAGVRITPADEGGIGEVRIVVGVIADSGLSFTRHELSSGTGVSYQPGADSRADVLSFDGIELDTSANPELSVEITADAEASEEPTTVTFVVGAVTCAVPVRIQGPDSE
ncbi:hypothetical protein [Nocardia sp. NPDC057668]|uniref:hypothetical protein n=1 Tax=Nocardia sp. NPDC057668 TaxID=3346202 RepID=UPI003672C1F9